MFTRTGIPLTIVAFGWVAKLAIGQEFEFEDPAAFYEQRAWLKASSSGFRPTAGLPRFRQKERDSQDAWKLAISGAPFTSCVFLGPSNVGGRTRALLIDKDRVFAGSVGGGLWVSNNRGADWAPIAGNDELASMIVSCIAQNPRNLQEIYFGTGEPFKESFYGGGVFCSRDGGSHFELLESTANDARFLYCLCLAHDKRSAETLYVGTRAPEQVLNSRDFGLLRSTDQGRIWQTVLGNQSVSDVVTFSDGSVLAACMGNGIYRSTTGHPGSFSRVAENVVAPPFQLVRLAQCRSEPDVVYAAFEGPTKRVVGENPTTPVKAILKSVDGGKNWVKMCSSVAYEPEGGIQDVANTAGNYCFCLAVHPDDSDRLVCGAVTMYASADAGVTWRTCAHSHQDIHAFATFADTPDDLLVGNDGGVFQYQWSDFDSTPKDLNTGYQVTQFYTGDCNGSAELIIGGTRDNGTLRVPDGYRLRGADGGYCFVSRNSNFALFSRQAMLIASDTQHGLYFIDNAAATPPTTPESRAFPPEMVAEGMAYINAYAVNSADDRQIYCRTNQALWRSTDRGTNWQPITRGNITGITAIACQNAPAPVVYFSGRRRSPLAAPRPGDQGAFLYRILAANSTPAGREVALSLTMPLCLRRDVIGDLCIDPLNSGNLLVAFSSYSAAPRIWRVETSDRPIPRVQWYDASGNLTADWGGANSVNSIAFDPLHPDHVFFCGSDLGLYYTLDGGRYWNKHPGIPNTMITELVVPEHERALLVFTHGRGVWRIQLE